MLWRDSTTPLPRSISFLFITTVFVLSIVSIIMLSVSVLCKLSLLFAALCYFIFLCIRLGKTPATILRLSDAEYLVTIDGKSTLAKLANDSIITRWVAVLLFKKS